MSSNPVVPKKEDERSKSGRHKPFNFHDYAVSILIALVLTVFYGGYYIIQRTYMFHAPPGIDAFYVPDKVIAVVGMILLAFTFLIGPIYRYFDAFDYLLEYRKEIGIVGGVFALFHPVMAYFFLPLTFPQSEIPLTSVTYGAGLVGSLVVIFLILISYENAKILLGPSRWWLLHRFGLRLVILFAVIHFFCIEWSTWVQWLGDRSRHEPASSRTPIFHLFLCGADRVQCLRIRPLDVLLQHTLVLEVYRLAAVPLFVDKVQVCGTDANVFVSVPEESEKWGGTSARSRSESVLTRPPTTRGRKLPAAATPDGAQPTSRATR